MGHPLLGLHASQPVSSTTVFWGDLTLSDTQDLGSLGRQDGRGNLALWINQITVPRKEERKPGQADRQTGFVMAQIWLQGCIQTQQSSYTGQPSAVLELLLIDVVDARLVQGTLMESDVALIYVSGGSRTTRTMRSNFQLLCQAGWTGGSSFPLPSLFVDIVSLVRKLGIRSFASSKYLLNFVNF